MSINEIVVGNVGSVYHGNDAAKAEVLYYTYVNLSQAEYGRAGGEDVTWFQDGEIHKEFQGSLAKSIDNEI